MTISNLKSFAAIIFFIFDVQVLQDFPHTSSCLPFEYLFDVIPQLQPRAFSIASSQVVSIPWYAN